MSNLEITAKYHCNSQSLLSSGCEFLCFSEQNGNLFYLNSLLNIQISHRLQYIEFKFIVSGTHPTIRSSDPKNEFNYEHTLMVNKFDIARLYNIKPAKAIDDISFCLYDDEDKNVFKQLNNKSLPNLSAEAKFKIADGIDTNVIIPIHSYNDKGAKLNSEDIVKNIIETSVWKFFN